jgi:hypothetical protein
MGILARASAFMRMRELAVVRALPDRRSQDELEQKTEGIALVHDTFSRNTRVSDQAAVGRHPRAHGAA